MLKLSDFDYNLPKELIAQYPLKKRDEARLLVLERAKAKIRHRIFKDIPEYLEKGDLVILNDTKVLPCRLSGFRLTGGKVEVLLTGRKQGLIFNALIKPARVKAEEKIIFNHGKISGRLLDKNIIAFDAKTIDSVYNLGTMPLPPYIKRLPEDLDKVYYQTVYARRSGAVAAPTAGLHFTGQSLERIKSCGAKVGYITLHVGPGTFKPVKSEDILKHKMEPEYFKIGKATQNLIEACRKRSSRIFAAGTTTLRALETYAKGNSLGYTDLFIYPGYKFRMTDCLITNFHLPRTTLFMLVCAFAGEGLAKKVYKEAIDKKYRFYSYGDAMLII